MGNSMERCVAARSRDSVSRSVFAGTMRAGRGRGGIAGSVGDTALRNAASSAVTTTKTPTTPAKIRLDGGKEVLFSGAVTCEGKIYIRKGSVYGLEGSLRVFVSG
jgi:hypothetical protein